MAGAVLDDLYRVFGPRADEFRTSTSRVLTSPSTLTREIVAKLANEFALDVVFRDLGAVCARELSNHIEAHALRPADYVEAPGLCQAITERLMQELGKDPEAFEQSFALHLKLRG